MASRLRGASTSLTGNKSRHKPTSPSSSGPTGDFATRPLRFRSRGFAPAEAVGSGPKPTARSMMETDRPRSRPRASGTFGDHLPPFRAYIPGWVPALPLEQGARALEPRQPDRERRLQGRSLTPCVPPSRPHSTFTPTDKHYHQTRGTAPARAPASGLRPSLLGYDPVRGSAAGDAALSRRSR